jgi:hypothetical protein
MSDKGIGISERCLMIGKFRYADKVSCGFYRSTARKPLVSAAARAGIFFFVTDALEWRRPSHCPTIERDAASLGRPSSALSKFG